MAELLPVGAYVRVTERHEGGTTYIARVVGYDMGRTKYEIGLRYWGWSEWLFLDGGSWTFPSWCQQITEAEATAITEEARRG